MEDNEELSNRELEALEAENTGSRDRRRFVVFDRWWDAIMARAGMVKEEKKDE